MCTKLGKNEYHFKLFWLSNCINLLEKDLKMAFCEEGNFYKEKKKVSLKKKRFKLSN